MSVGGIGRNTSPTGETEYDYIRRLRRRNNAMKFLVDLAGDLARDLAVVTLVLAVICAAGWMIFGRDDPESDSKMAPPK